MKHLFLLSVALFAAMGADAADVDVKSPAGKLVVSVSDDGGTPGYKVSYDGTVMLERSALGLKTDIADFTSGLIIDKSDESKIDKSMK